MKLEEFLKDKTIPYRKDVPLRQLTGMSLSGLLPYVAQPINVEMLKELYLYVLDNGVSYELAGGLTNTYLCSGFERDIIIQTTKVQDLSFTDKTVEVGCGYPLTKLSRMLSDKGITGYEGFIGIPGTVGGAAINNSSAFGSVMADVVLEVKIIDENGQFKTLSHDDMKYVTRGSSLKKKSFGVVTSVVLDISSKQSPAVIAELVDKVISERKKNIDGKRKSLGSIIVGSTVPRIWEHHKLALFVRKVLYAPFKYTPVHKKVDCFLDFLVLGKPSLAKHCDNLGRFCWTKDTSEEVFFEYIDFLRHVSRDKIELEIEIKK